MSKPLYRDWITSAAICLYPGALCCLFFPNPGLILTLGLLLFGLELLCFVQHADNSIDLRVLLRMSALLFMWVSPAASYFFAEASWYHATYKMAVEPAFYFALIIPCTVAFNLALWVPVGTERVWAGSGNKWQGWLLLSIGLTTQQLAQYFDIPFWLRHPVFLTGQLWLVGLLFLQQAYPNRRWLILGGGLVYLLHIALQSTLFGYSIIWSVILLCYTLKVGEISWRFRLAGMMAMILLVLFLLSFKYEYRQQVWHEQRSEPNWQIFLRMTVQRILNPADLLQPEIFQHYTDRLNQGYHTAMAMAYVPAQEPFAHGATLLEDVRAALLPRLWAPDKHKAGGAENIRRFSGIQAQRWSSNIGHFGEAYVNFGVGGAWIVMLGYGLLISAAVWAMQRYFPLPWLAFVLEPVLNVEEDIGMGMNHLTKSLLFVLAVVVVARIVTRLVAK